MAQCITCFRCVRICDELQGQFVWQVWNRGDATDIRPDSGTTLLKSSCVGCGACVDSCPSGALEDKSVLDFGVAEKWTRTTCPYCGVGCEMLVGTRDNRIVQVKPALDPCSGSSMANKPPTRTSSATLFEPRKVFRRKIENGTIRKLADGQVPRLPDGQPAAGGDLMTKDTYRDFELTWEWRATPGANRRATNG